MTETAPGEPGSIRLAGELAAVDPLACGPLAAVDPLAAALLRAQRLLCSVDVEPDVRLRLHLRFTAICTSLKMPTARRARGAERLERLIADATAASRWEGERRAN